MTICSVDGCERTVKARTYCDMHLARLYRTGSTGIGTQKHNIHSDRFKVSELLITKCRADGCEENSVGMGFCNKHYTEFGFSKRRKKS